MFKCVDAQPSNSRAEYTKLTKPAEKRILQLLVPSFEFSEEFVVKANFPLLSIRLSRSSFLNQAKRPFGLLRDVIDHVCLCSGQRI